MSASLSIVVPVDLFVVTYSLTLMKGVRSNQSQYQAIVTLLITLGRSISTKGAAVISNDDMVTSRLLLTIIPNVR